MATAAERLAEAKEALHQLRLGKGVVTIAVTGPDGSQRDVTYQKADLADLKAYIAELEAEVAGKPLRGAIPIRF